MSLPYTEHFSGSCARWPTRDDKQLQAGCANGVYRVLVRNARNVQFFTVPITASAVRVEADVRVAAGHAPRKYGLGCFTGRDSIGVLYGDWAVVTPSEGYDIVDYTENARAHTARATPLSTDRHVVSVRNTYHLQLDCSSSVLGITMRVGHRKAFSAPNTGFLASIPAGLKPSAFKHVGFVVFPSSSGSDVRFDNFRVDRLAAKAQ